MQHLHRLRRAVAATLVAIVTLLAVSGAALAQTPSPATSPAPSIQPVQGLTLQARPLLGGHVRPGAWTAVEVTIANDGPPIIGELRIRGPQQTQSRYGVEAELPTGARQRFTLYAQTAVFGSRVHVDLVSGEQTVATQQVAITSHDAYTPIVAVIADRPEGVLADIRDALTDPNLVSSSVITLNPEDLPERVEAWAAVDRLVWQDVDAAELSVDQMQALRLWLGAGGRLIVLGGTTGGGALRGFDRDGVRLLPYDPAVTVDVAPADLAGLLGTPPAGATNVPAFAGVLDHGTILARAGDQVIAAEAGYGRGAVTLIGFDPSTPWIANGASAEALWRRLTPQSSSPVLNPLTITDDSQIVYALQNLPSVDLPPIEQLFVMLIAYIALIGPVNYLVLRKLDRREWAWITIPALVAVFSFGTFGLGATLKGSDIIINQITVVRAAQGTDRGIGQAYVGIYSPSRRTFDVRIPGGALLSNPTSQAQMGGTETPLDVVFGSTSSRLRNFEVGFGVLRGFRAEAPADAPRVDADLRLAGGILSGTVTNRSDRKLEHVAVVFSGAAAVLSELEPGQTKEVELDVSSINLAGAGLSDVIFGSTFPRDSVQARVVQTRRAVIDQLFPWGSQAQADSPLLLAWSKGPVLDVQLAGDTPNRVGEGLFMVPLSMNIAPNQIFSDPMIRRTVVETTAANGWNDGSGYYLSRGTMTVEARPARFSGVFSATSLEVAITQGEMRRLTGRGDVVQPLPADQQPPQDDPLAEPGSEPSPAPSAEPSTDPGTEPGGGEPPKPGQPPLPVDPVPDFQFDNLPDFQIRDHTTGLWMEFAHPRPNESYLIAEAHRYVDESGSVLFRFINRADGGQFGEEQSYFQLQVRIEGTIQ